MVWTPRLYGHREDTKDTLFGELEKKRPCHGTKKRWHDGIKADLQAIGIGDNWYTRAKIDL